MFKPSITLPVGENEILMYNLLTGIFPPLLLQPGDIKGMNPDWSGLDVLIYPANASELDRGL